MRRAFVVWRGDRAAEFGREWWELARFTKGLRLSTVEDPLGASRLPAKRPIQEHEYPVFVEGLLRVLDLADDACRRSARRIHFGLTHAQLDAASPYVVTEADPSLSRIAGLAHTTRPDSLWRSVRISSQTKILRVSACLGESSHVRACIRVCIGTCTHAITAKNVRKLVNACERGYVCLMAITPRDATAPEPAVDQILYTPEEASEIVKLTPYWLKYKARLGLIPHRRVGRLFRFAIEDLEAIKEMSAQPVKQARESA